jgi:formamidopyrimidine-DNA glycosylase
MGFELPEILTISKQMDSAVKGKILENVLLGSRCSGLIKLGMCNLAKRKNDIVNAAIHLITGKGKWIFLEFDNGRLLMLGELIGKLLYHKSSSEVPQIYHVLFEFNDGTSLTFLPSLYGFLEVTDGDQLGKHKYAGNIGISPDNMEFTYKYFRDVLHSNESKPLKAVLGLQSQVSGLGNAYINDILYESMIHPKRKAGELSDNEKVRIYKTTVAIVSSAIELNGCAQELDLFGNPGRYIRIMDKESVNKECKRCGTRIVKMNILGSSSYICPECQKI